MFLTDSLPVLAREFCPIRCHSLYFVCRKPNFCLHTQLYCIDLNAEFGLRKVD